MDRRIVWGLFTLGVVAVVGGGWMVLTPHEKPTASYVEAVEEETEGGLHEEHLSLIEDYFAGLANADDLSSLLIGEALRNYETQRGQASPFEYALDAVEPLLVEEDLAVAHVKVAYSREGTQDVDHQVLILFADGTEGWKIAQVRREIPVWALSPHKEETDGIASEGLIREYLANVAQGEWEEAMNLTGGSLKRITQESLGVLPSGLLSEQRDIHMEKAFEREDVEGVIVRHEAETPWAVRKLTTLFITEKAGDERLIVDQILLKETE